MPLSLPRNAFEEFSLDSIEPLTRDNKNQLCNEKIISVDRENFEFDDACARSDGLTMNLRERARKMSVTANTPAIGGRFVGDVTIRDFSKLRGSHKKIEIQLKSERIMKLWLTELTIDPK